MPMPATRWRGTGQWCCWAERAMCGFSLMAIPRHGQPDQGESALRGCAGTNTSDIKIVSRSATTTDRRSRRRRNAARYPGISGIWRDSAAWRRRAGRERRLRSSKPAGSGRSKIVAMDRDEATLQFIQEGVIDASIAQRTQARCLYLALQLLYDLRATTGSISLTTGKRPGSIPRPPMSIRDAS